jgi:hypothetical protein
LLTPWESTPELQQIILTVHAQIEQIVAHSLDPQVAYASLDLADSKIMMHRLHTDIQCFVQVCMASESCAKLATHFCTDSNINLTHTRDYENINFFRDDQLCAVSYRPNTAYIFLNQPRMFMGTKNAVPANMLRETFNLHFGHRRPLESNT